MLLSSSPSLLLALAGFFLAAQSHPQQIQRVQCPSVTTTAVGITNTNPHPVPTIIIPAHKAQLDYQIPSDEMCEKEGSTPVGVSVTVCDTYEAAEVLVPSLRRTRVHRYGPLPNVATVDIVVFCDDARQGQAKG